MKKLVLIGFLLLNLSVFAQRDCELSTNVKDSLGYYKATKSCIVYEKNFAGKNLYVFFSLINDNGMPYLNLQTIKKSESFIAANCMDENSKLYLQLMNGKIITMLHSKDSDCGTLIRIPGEIKYSRVNSSNFMFMKGSIEELKLSPITLIKIKSGIDAAEYVMVKELKSELNNETYYPENYFINNFKCIE
jgi:hypothetical protein